MNETTNTDSKLIATYNDIFRFADRGVRMTNGVYALPDLDGLMKAVRNYKGFDNKNDPYNEHDFGVIKWHGKEVYWRIDYFNKSLEYWVSPLSPDCRRVLTVMLATEY